MHKKVNNKDIQHFSLSLFIVTASEGCRSVSELLVLCINTYFNVYCILTIYSFAYCRPLRRFLSIGKNHIASTYFRQYSRRTTEYEALNKWFGSNFTCQNDLQSERDLTSVSNIKSPTHWLLWMAVL